MGVRIAALWKKKKDDGSVTVTGTVEVATGLNIPAGSKNTGISLIPNDKKTAGDNLPDYYIEVWTKTDKDIPF